MDTCSHCGVDLPEQATFCPACGRRTDAPPPDPAVLPVGVRPAAPRYFGLVSPPMILAMAVGLVALGIALIVVDHLVPGVIAIIVGVCLLPSFLAGARRWPDTPLARVSVGTADRVRDEADVAVESISTWSKAGRDLVRHRKQQFQLRRERDAKIRELGVSAYAEDGRESELRAAAKELDKRHRGERADDAAHDRRRTQAGPEGAGRRRRDRGDRAQAAARAGEDEEDDESRS